jgi:hypothetical protein
MLRIVSLLLLLCCLVTDLPAQNQKGINFAAANAAFDAGVQLLLAGKPSNRIQGTSRRIVSWACHMILSGILL